MMRVSIQEPEMDIWRLRGEDHVKTEAELGVMLPEVKEHQGHQRLEEVRKGPPLEPLGEWAPCTPELREDAVPLF